MLTLREIIASQTALAEELPLVHTTRGKALSQIIANHELRSENSCDVFNEHLIYFFYGRPAYRLVGGNKPGSGIELCPICFVFKPHTIGYSTKRVFACDSGAIQHGNFAPHIAPTDLTALELEASLESARRMVTLVFGNNEKYFLGQAQKTMPSSFSPGTTAHRFHALLTDETGLNADDRRSAIEVQLPSPVAIDHHLLYVLLPKDVLNDSQVRRTIIEIWQCDPIGYDVYPGSAPNNYTANIREVLKQRFKDGGRL